MIAIENNNYEIVKLLIQCDKVNINLKNYENQTALTFAAKNDSEEIVDLIIKNKSFDPIESQLDYAFYLSKKRTSSQLLSLKSLNVNYILLNLNDDDDNKKSFVSTTSTPVNRYSFRQVKKFSFYPKKETSNISKISPSIRNYALLNKTTLVNAVFSNDIEKIDMIIHHQSYDPIKSQIDEAINLAVQLDNVLIFNKLLPQINNDINFQYHHNESLLEIASKNNSKSVIQEIIKNTNFDSSKSNMDKAFSNLLSNSSRIELDMLDLMLKHDDSHLINFSNTLPNGKSFFTTLSYKIDNLTEVINYLIKHGADPNLADKFDETPLQYAIVNESAEFVEALLNSKSIDFSKQIHFPMKYNEYTESDVTSSYLHLAAKIGNYGIFCQIIELNLIDINIIDSEGETPLMVSVRYKRIDITKKLFESDDLNCNLCNNKGNDVLDIYHNSNNVYFGPKPYEKKIYYDTIISDK